MAAAQQSSQKSVCVTILLTFIIVLQVQELGLNIDFGTVLTWELHSDFYEIPMMIIIMLPQYSSEWLSKGLQAHWLILDCNEKAT